jgi:hypothetical protein
VLERSPESLPNRGDADGMSAMPPIATELLHYGKQRDGQFTKSARLFDHFVGGNQKDRWHGEGAQC